MRNTWLSTSVVVLAAMMVAGYGCGTNTGISAISNVRRTPPQSHLYLSRAPVSDPGEIDVYSLPMTSASNPVARLVSATEAPLGLAFDGTGRLFASTGDGRVKVWTPPITSGANPAFVLTIGGHYLAFDGAGNLFDGGTAYGGNCGTRWHPISFATTGMNVVSSPITGSSITNFSITEPTVCGGPPLLGLAFDHGGNLWAALYYRLDMFSPPFTSSSNPALSVSTCASGLAFDSAGNMYVGGCDGIDVFQPPFSSSMTKAYAISSAANASTIAFDSAGNMYDVSLIPFSSANGLQVFSPPFSSSSQPVVTFSGNFAGVAIGR